MRTSTGRAGSYRISAALFGLVIATAAPAHAGANVITDWDEKSVAFVTAYIPGPMGSRAVAMVHLAMFDAVNSIEPRYRPYLGQLAAPAGTSKEAAAAAAAGAVLAALVSNNDKARSQLRDTMAAYLSTLPDGEAKSNGIKLGESAPPRSWTRAQTMAQARRMNTDRERRPACTCRRN
jgi:hypothetical protein